MTDTLNTLRKQLDAVDAEIVKLLEQRFEITDQVALYKDTHAIPLTDKTREQEVLEGIRNSVQHGVLKEHVSEIYEKIFSLNKTARQLKQSLELPFTRIGVIGLGMMGGSIVKALRMKNPELEVNTLKRDSADTALAVKQGYITTVFEDVKALAAHCELIIIAAPIDSVVPIAKEIAAARADLGAKEVTGKPLLVVDIGSVKEKIAHEFEKLTTESTSFLATHPMAGSEKIGFENTQGMLFVGTPWIVCPHKENTPHQITQIKQFVKYLGSLPVVTTPKQHDQEVAAVSHIVFLLSTYLFAFISEKHPAALKLAGSGFVSLTRLASGSPQMHSQIITQNYEHCMISLVELLEFIKKDSLTPDTLLSFFKRTKKSRDRFLTERV